MIKLFQFWNKLVAPSYVEEQMATWAQDDNFDYQRFDVESAATFIKLNFDERTLSAYRACGVPAMQADFFRYCALYVEGGVYVDADTQNSGKLPQLLSGRIRGILMNRQQNVANDFLFVSGVRDPLYSQVIEKAILNIENRISNNVWEVTGPGIMTHMYLDSESKRIFNGFDFEPAKVVRDYVLFVHEQPYKLENEDWRSFSKSVSRSIYSE